MKKYILLLRGINVGGKNKVSMKELKKLMEDRGFADVVSYINSGNVIFSSDQKDRVVLKHELEALLLEGFGLELKVTVILADLISEALDHAPEWWGLNPEDKNNVIFVIPPMTAEKAIEVVGECKLDYEKVDFYGDVIFWTAPLKTFSKTRWSKVVNTTVYEYITIRNANTVKKLVDLCNNSKKG